MKFQIEVEIEGDDNFSKLMRKWTELFKNRNLLIDPMQKEENVIYVDRDLRAERANEIEIKELSAADRHAFYSKDDRCLPKMMSINSYITDKSMVDIGKIENDIRVVQLIANRFVFKGPVHATEYYICYYADKNNTDAYLLFCFDIDDLMVKKREKDDGVYSPYGFLRLEFKSGDIKLSCEKRMAYHDTGSVSYGSAIKGLLAKNGIKKGFCELLDAYVEKPYTLSPAEAEKRAKIEKGEKRKEAEHEKQMEELRRQEEERARQEQIRREEEERKKEEQRIAEANAKRKATMDALDNF